MKAETITIKKIINNGYGLGHLADGRAILLRHVLPGEEVLVNGIKLQKDTLFCTQLQLLTTHPGRKSPPCPYYQKCGGCDLQHAKYDDQLSIKREILIDLLKRQGNPTLIKAASGVAPVMPSPDRFHYRQRIRLHRTSGSQLGFRHFQSHNIVPVEACLLAVAQLNDCLAALHNSPSGRILRELCTGIELQFNPISGKTVVLIDLAEKPRPRAIQTAEALVAAEATIECCYFRGDKFALTGPFPKEIATDTEHRLRIDYPGTHFRPPFSLTWETGSFCQVNLVQNGRMIDYLLSATRIQSHETVLDLYCGMGNFSLPLAMVAQHLHGYEGQAAAIRSAADNCRRFGLANTTFAKLPVHAACDELVRQGKRFDVVIVDPPRQGIPGLAGPLAKLCRDRLLYVSCDPATLVRDLGQLINEGFVLHSLQPVDMFPQTHHVETVALLTIASK